MDNKAIATLLYEALVDAGAQDVQMDEDENGNELNSIYVAFDDGPPKLITWSDATPRGG